MTVALGIHITHLFWKGWGSLEIPTALLLEMIGIPRDSLGITRDSLGNPKDSLGIPRDSLGNPKDSLEIPMGRTCFGDHYGVLCL